MWVCYVTQSTLKTVKDCAMKVIGAKKNKGAETWLRAEPAVRTSGF